MTPLRGQIDTQRNSYNTKNTPLILTSSGRGRTICPRPCTPHAAAQLQRIHALRLACGAQRALLPLAVGTMNIHDVRDGQTDRHQTSDAHHRFKMPPANNRMGISWEMFSFDIVPIPKLNISTMRSGAYDALVRRVPRVAVSRNVDILICRRLEEIGCCGSYVISTPPILQFDLS